MRGHGLFMSLDIQAPMSLGERSHLSGPKFKWAKSVACIYLKIYIYIYIFQKGFAFRLASVGIYLLSIYLQFI